MLKRGKTLKWRQIRYLRAAEMKALKRGQVCERTKV